MDPILTVKSYLATVIAPVAGAALGYYVGGKVKSTQEAKLIGGALGFALGMRLYFGLAVASPPPVVNS